jgi:signal transduction histidine kinase
VPAEPLRVVVDAHRLAQVVTNYVTNALKCSADDRPVAVSVQREEGRRAGVRQGIA